jgi:hypothetical protein
MTFSFNIPSSAAKVRLGRGRTRSFGPFLLMLGKDECASKSDSRCAYIREQECSNAQSFENSRDLLVVCRTNYVPLVGTSRSLVLRTLLDGLTDVRIDE